jgi:hypothetical protein
LAASVTHRPDLRTLREAISSWSDRSHSRTPSTCRRLTHLVGAANTTTLFEKTCRFTLNRLDATISRRRRGLRNAHRRFAADHALFRHPKFESIAISVAVLESRRSNPYAGFRAAVARDEFRVVRDGGRRFRRTDQLRHGSNRRARSAAAIRWFQSEMGTLFIRYIGDVLSRCSRGCRTVHNDS